jgi:hypothetical protein
MLIHKETLPYYSELANLRSFLEREVEGFPRWKCESASRLVHLRTGLEVVAGRYVPDEDLHVWNYDSQRELYVDITQDQYPHRSKIAVMPANTPLLKVEGNAMKEHHAATKQRGFQRQVSDLLRDYLFNQNTRHHQK